MGDAVLEAGPGSYVVKPRRAPQAWQGHGKDREAAMQREDFHGMERLAQRLVLSTAASASKAEGTSKHYAHMLRFSRDEDPCVNQDLDMGAR